MNPPRIDLTRSEITRVVKIFYARVRNHQLLGPIFSHHVNDWPEHEEKIIQFWASAILFEQSYTGNPMMAHMQAGNVHAEHFPTWLALFDSVLNEEIKNDQAQQWSRLAHRIGRGLSFGLQDIKRHSNEVPRL